MGRPANRPLPIPHEGPSSLRVYRREALTLSSSCPAARARSSPTIRQSEYRAHSSAASVVGLSLKSSKQPHRSITLPTPEIQEGRAKRKSELIYRQYTAGVISVRKDSRHFGHPRIVQARAVKPFFCFRSPCSGVPGLLRIIKLPNTVMSITVGSTAAGVVAILMVVAKYLFPKHGPSHS